MPQLNSSQIRTRKAILNTFNQLLAVRPFDQISVRLICETVPVHHSTFYRYFDDKFDLLQGYLIAEYDAVKDSADHLTAIIDQIMTHWAQFENITRFNAQRDIYYELINMVSNILNEQALHTTTPGLLLDMVRESPHADYATYGLAGSVVGVIIKWNQQPDVNPNDLRQLFTDLAVDWQVQLAGIRHNAQSGASSADFS